MPSVGHMPTVGAQPARAQPLPRVLERAASKAAGFAAALGTMQAQADLAFKSIPIGARVAELPDGKLQVLRRWMDGLEIDCESCSAWSPTIYPA